MRTLLSFFRFLSYDGFVKIFDRNYHGTTKIRKGNCYQMEVTDSRLLVRKKRVGILSTHALRRVSGQDYEENKSKTYSSPIVHLLH